MFGIMLTRGYSAEKCYGVCTIEESTPVCWMCYIAQLLAALAASVQWNNKFLLGRLLEAVK